MVSKFFKKSIASKLFLMNLIILVCIVITQLLFQALYFETYYINQKEKLLKEDISEFKPILLSNDKKKIMNFIQEVKKKDNVALSFKNHYLMDGIGLDFYMNDKQIVIKDKENNEKFKIVIGDIFSNLHIKKNDIIQVVGIKNEYDYIFPSKIFVNGKEIIPSYEIVPTNDVLNSASTQCAAISINSNNKGTISIEGTVENIIPKDELNITINDMSSILDEAQKYNIVKNLKYNGKIKNIDNNNELLLSSERFNNGYIIAITQLSQVNDVIGTMNKYYFIIFFLTFLLVLIISLIYSKFITKPLVEMSKVAKSISECNFENKYKVNSEDEIGLLGDSLNSISENLQKSLNELQNANIKLKEDMNIQKIQEEKRKELIANISHELKTPITIIQGSITGIRNGIYSTEMYEDILEETNKMNDLVKEMLEISKLESPSFKLKEEPFDLWSLFLKEYDKLKPMIEEKNLKFNFNMDDEAVVLGDEKRISQVIINLLTNSIKYTPAGENINVKIDFKYENNIYIFSIENFGTILKQAEREKIWDSFYRAEKSRNKTLGGTGLGLSIVKRILELHKSNYGVKGSLNSVEFYFSLPKCMDY